MRRHRHRHRRRRGPRPKSSSSRACVPKPFSFQPHPQASLSSPLHVHSAGQAHTRVNFAPPERRFHPPRRRALHRACHPLQVHMRVSKAMGRARPSRGLASLKHRLCLSEVVRVQEYLSTCTMRHLSPHRSRSPRASRPTCPPDPRLSASVRGRPRTRCHCNSTEPHVVTVRQLDMEQPGSLNEHSNSECSTMTLQ